MKSPTNNQIYQMAVAIDELNLDSSSLPPEPEDIKKEVFAFDLYTQLQDEFGMVDRNGELAQRISHAKGTELDYLIRTLQSEIVHNIRDSIF